MGIFPIRIVESAEHFIHRDLQIHRNILDQLLIARFPQQIFHHGNRIADEFFIQNGQQAPLAPITLPCGILIGHFFQQNGGDVPLQRAAQQIIQRYLIKIRHLHQKGKPTFADALFIMGKQRLRDAQRVGDLLLRKPRFLAQMHQKAGKFRNCHRDLFLRFYKTSTF